MTKTQDELLAAVERAEEGITSNYAMTLGGAVVNAADLRLILAALRSLDSEVERLRGALQFYADEPAREFPSDGPWGVNSDDFGRVARAALSSNSGGR